MNNNLDKLEKTIGYSFGDKSILELALTHSSFLQLEKADKTKCNERLEFIGDGLLDSIIGNELYTLMPDVGEGELTKVRATIVCERTLATVGREINLSQYLKMSKGEEQLGGRDKDSIIADGVEALIGACYMDSSYESCQKLVLSLFDELIKKGVSHELIKDYKSFVQEELQKKGSIDTLEYKVKQEIGPSHDKTFYIDLYFQGQIIGSGVGKKKKEAEQEAARAALEKGGYI